MIPSPTEIYTLSLHDALPILAITLHLSRTAPAFPFEIAKIAAWARIHGGDQHKLRGESDTARSTGDGDFRSEEHTSELQSLTNLVCRLLLEKKKNTKIILSHV